MTVEPGDDTGARTPARPDASMGLLTQVLEHPVDDDYYRVASRRAAGRERARPSGKVLLVLALVCLGLLVAVAAVRTQQQAPAEAAARARLIASIQRQSDQVERMRNRIADLQGSVNRLQTATLAASRRGRMLDARLARLGLAAGTVPAIGPGVTITVDNAPGDSDGGQGRVLDVDLQSLVNGLWVAGAEAVAINGQRVSNLTAIRGAGQAVTVNFTSLSPPYVVSAIGNPNTLQARFLESEGGQRWTDLQSNFGLRFAMRTDTLLRLPAVRQPVLHWARAAGAHAAAREAAHQPAKPSTRPGAQR